MQKHLLVSELVCILLQQLTTQMVDMAIVLTCECSHIPLLELYTTAERALLTATMVLCSLFRIAALCGILFTLAQLVHQCAWHHSK